MLWSDTEIKSARLLLRPFSSADAVDAFMCITPALTRYMVFEPAPSLAAFEVIWSGWLLRIEAGVDFTFTIRHRVTGRFIGLAALHRTFDPEPELGILVHKDEQGQGYGSEAVKAVAAWATTTFQVDAFIYPVAELNLPSRRIAESLGGTVYAENTMPKYRAVVYRIPSPRET